MLGYKVAEHASKRVIITLEIPDHALTNINYVYTANRETAKYRTNKAYVVKIEDENGKLYKTARSNQYLNKSLTYKVGELIEEPNFDMNLIYVCAEGIHFFLNKRVAELYGLTFVQNGLYERWHANGQKECEVFYVNGREEGLYQSWYYNGKLSERVMFVNGTPHGLYEKWSDDNLWYDNDINYKVCQVNYVNGKMEGLYQSWYSNSKKESEVMYVDGKKHGLANFWYENGEKRYFATYHYGKLVKIH